MILVTIDLARAHCRSDSDDDTVLITYVSAAEKAAQDFLDRFVYPDAGTMATAIAALPAAIDTAYNAWTAAVAAANDLPPEQAEIVKCGAHKAWKNAVDVARKTNGGLVVNDTIRAAVLLTAAHLYKNREDVLAGASAGAVELPNGAKTMLWPDRMVGV
jgi:hypothetical protein